jgi:glycine cleavage system aminomethyltransferase T
MVSFDAAFDLHALPRDYGHIDAEARSCRSAAALFDFSFMQHIRIRGPRACALIAMLTPRRSDDLPPGRIRYALVTDAKAHVVGDLTMWRLDAETFDIFVPPGDVYAQLRAGADASTSVSNLSDETAVLAVQGPTSLRALARVGPAAELRALSYFGHVQTSLAGVDCRVARLGYTGERGFEIVLPRAARDPLWPALAEQARPAGFAAADILRIEAGFPLFTNEFRFPIRAAELGLEQFAPATSAVCKGNPEGRATAVRLICFRAHCNNRPVLWQPSPAATFPPKPGTVIVTSACRSIIGGDVVGLGYVLHGSTDFVDGQGQFWDIQRTSLPFYDLHKRRPRGEWDDSLCPIVDQGRHSSD